MREADGSTNGATTRGAAGPSGGGSFHEGEQARRIVRFELAPETLIQVVLVVACAWLLIPLWPVLLAVVGALMMVGTLSPTVSWMESRGIRRGYGIAIVFTLLFVGAILVMTITVPSLMEQASTMVEQWPALRERVSEYLERFGLTAPLAHWLREFEFEPPSTSDLKETAFGIVGFVIYGASTIFLALYIMIDRDRLRGGLFAAVPRTHHIRLSRVLVNLEAIVGAYIRGQLLTSFFVAVFAFLLLMACGVPNAMAFAVFAGIADVLPYIGALLAITPMVLAAMAQGPAVMAIVLLAMLAYEEFESRVIIPRLYGCVLRLPSSVVLFALLAGGALMGILGALLALPVAAAVRMLIEELRVDLPGHQDQESDVEHRIADERAEEEYEQRTDGVSEDQAAAIAVEISNDRHKKSCPPGAEAVSESRG